MNPQEHDSNATNKSKEVYKQSADEFRMAIRIMEELDEENKPANMVQIYYYGAKAMALSEDPSRKRQTRRHWTFSI